MNPETSKSAAISFFQTLCSFWRTYHWILQHHAPAKKQAEESCFRFVQDEQQRLKNVVPDVGKKNVSLLWTIVLIILIGREH